jgi:hypothetical protein
MFHRTFLSLVSGEDPLEVEIGPEVKNVNFDMLPRNVDTIHRLAPIFLKSMKREQELLKTHSDYYVARDLSTNVIYVCFRDLLMVDIDRQKVSGEIMTDQTILERFDVLDKCFHVFKTRNGYHIFCISQAWVYRDNTTMQFMMDNFCDFYYCVFSYIRGFSVRLNRKFSENLPLYTDLGLTGNTSLVEPRLESLVSKHIKLVDKYKSTLNLN